MFVCISFLFVYSKKDTKKPNDTRKERKIASITSNQISSLKELIENFKLSNIQSNAVTLVKNGDPKILRADAEIDAPPKAKIVHGDIMRLKDNNTSHRYYSYTNCKTFWS